MVDVFMKFFLLFSLLLVSTAQARDGFYSTREMDDPQEMEISTSRQAYCREYTQTLQIGDIVQNDHGTACQRPDGSWELTPSNQDAADNQVAPNIIYVIRNNNLGNNNLVYLPGRKHHYNDNDNYEHHDKTDAPKQEKPKQLEKHDISR